MVIVNDGSPDNTSKVHAYLIIILCCECVLFVCIGGNEVYQCHSMVQTLCVFLSLNVIEEKEEL